MAWPVYVVNAGVAVYVVSADIEELPEAGVVAWAAAVATRARSVSECIFVLMGGRVVSVCDERSNLLVTATLLHVIIFVP